MPENEENNQIQIIEPHQLAYAEIESQIATAKRYPRKIAEFKDKLMSMANLDQSTAEGCYYALPRAGKSISGPSIRFAEIALSCYGNAVAQADIIKEDDKYVYAMGMCRDLENNVAVRMTVRRRITNKQGRRFNDDMIATTANAACAIALRNVIFKVVPAAFTKAAFDKVKETAVGKAGSFANRRAEVLSRLGKLGVEEKRILAVLERPSIDEVTINDVAMLIGLGTAIHDGETTLDEAFPKPPEGKPGVEGLRDKLKESTPTKTQTRPVESTTTPTTQTEPEKLKKKGGRPKGSKNKQKAEAQPESQPEPEAKTKEEVADTEDWPESLPTGDPSEQPEEQPTAADKLKDYLYSCKKCGLKFDVPSVGHENKTQCPNCFTYEIVVNADEK